MMNDLDESIKKPLINKGARVWQTSRVNSSK